MSGTPAARPNKVLIVDGDFRSSQRLGALLGEDGYDVDVVRDASAAIVRLGQAPTPDVLITELRLPLGDGLALARYARSQSSAVQIVVLTRYPNLFAPGDFGAHPTTLLTKPLDYQRLLEALGQHGENGRNAASPRI